MILNTVVAGALIGAASGGSGSGGGSGGGGTPAPAAAITGLQVGVASSTSLLLEWTNNATDGTAIRVDRSTNGGSSWTDFYDSIDPSETSYLDDSLTTDQAYMYRLWTYNGPTQCVSPSTVTGTPVSAPPSSPTAPSNPSALMQAVNTTIRVTWDDNSSNETGFKVWRSVNGGAYAVWHTTAAGVEQYDDGGLTLGYTYSYKISATNSAGDSAVTTPVTVNTLGLPGTPTGLTAAIISATRVDLEWVYSDTPPAGDESSFNVYRSVNGEAFALLAVNAAEDHTYSDLTVSAGSSYSYKVAAVNGAGTGAQSAPAPVYLVPTAPSGLSYAVIGDEPFFIRFTWVDNSSGETGFNLYRDAGLGFVYWVSVGAGVTQADVEGEDARGHDFYVKAYSAAGESTASNTVSVL